MESSAGTTVTAASMTVYDIFYLEYCLNGPFSRLPLLPYQPKNDHDSDVAKKSSFSRTGRTLLLGFPLVLCLPVLVSIPSLSFDPISFGVTSERTPL
jgi:hypothetical protein